MKFVINEPESEQSIYVEQIDHGKFAKISSTSLLLNVGALGPALRAGSPVTGSVTSLTRCSRLRRGVNTIRPFSILASSGSPARISRRRRSGPGRTTCPLVETLVCMVRQSYHYRAYLARGLHIHSEEMRTAISSPEWFVCQLCVTSDDGKPSRPVLRGGTSAMGSGYSIPPAVQKRRSF